MAKGMDAKTGYSLSMEQYQLYCKINMIGAASPQEGHPIVSSGNFMLRLFYSVLAIISAGMPVHAQMATIDSVGCGTSCRQVITQLSPVSKTAGGYPRVLVAKKTILYPDPKHTDLGYDHAGDLIIKWRRDTYPKNDKSWIIAGCLNRRVALYAKHSDGLDASWV